MITLSLVYFGFVGALYGMQFWLPQIVKAFGLTNAQTGFVTAIPYLFGTIAMILWARHSDATRERVAHVGGPLLLTAAALAVSSYITDPTTTMIVLTVAAIGVFCTFAVFWTLPTAWLSGTAAAGAIALINSVGNLAGFGGPYLIGWVKEATGQRRPVCWCCRCCRSPRGCWCFLAATTPRPSSPVRGRRSKGVLARHSRRDAKHRTRNRGRNIRVAPANAGAHTPRPLEGALGADVFFHHQEFGLWAPAFAGATTILCPRQPLSSQISVY